VFHVELRQFPHVARTFNLTAEALHSRVVGPWVAGRPVELEERKWAPDRAKVTIYQARELAGGEIGMGRGWGTVTRDGEDVTERLLAAARAQEEAPGELAEIKARLLASLGDATIPLGHVVEAMGDDTWRVSERLALAEQAVWELLHEERLSLIQDGSPVPRDRWQPLVLRWASWAPGSDVSVRADDQRHRP
jgi:hypothetical protein